MACTRWPSPGTEIWIEVLHGRGHPLWGMTWCWVDRARTEMNWAEINDAQAYLFINSLIKACLLKKLFSSC